MGGEILIVCVKWMLTFAIPYSGTDKLSPNFTVILHQIFLMKRAHIHACACTHKHAYRSTELDIYLHINSYAYIYILRTGRNIYLYTEIDGTILV